MNKQDLVTDIVENADISKAAAERVVERVFSSIVSAVHRGEEVRLVGFGTFSAKRREASEGRNPRTGEKIQIAAQTLPKFSASKAFKDRLNRG